MHSRERAYADFGAARRKAFWDEIAAFLSGRQSQLLSWNEVRDKLGLRGQVYRGIQTVPVDKIIGSVFNQVDAGVAKYYGYKKYGSYGYGKKEKKQKII